MDMRKNRIKVLLALLFALALALPAGLAEEVVAAPVELPVGEADETELWAEADAEPVDAGVAALEGACTREMFATWYEGAKARAAGANHLLGPDGDINNNPVTVILPGETVAVVPIYSLDNDNDYSIQGGIMAFGFDIYQLDGEKVETESFGKNLLPRSSLPASTKLTETAWEKMPVPYGARIGLTEIVDDSVLDVSYTSGYVNDTGLPIMLLKSELGSWDGAGKMLGKGGSYGEHSFQGDGRISHGPTFYFLENAYQVTIDTSAVLLTSDETDSDGAKELIWPNGEPQATINLPVDGKDFTFELPSPIRKGYHFDGWRPKETYGWPWGMLAYTGSTTRNDQQGCCASTLSEDKTTVTINLLRSILEYEGFAQRSGNLHDYVLSPTFMMPISDRDGLTLGFNPQGGTINGKDYYLCETKGITTQFSVDITKIVPVREGYTFVGWCTDPEQPTESLIDDPSPEGAYYWAKKGHTELYAVWNGGKPEEEKPEDGQTEDGKTDDGQPGAKTSIANAEVAAIKAQTYTGKAIEPDVVVTLDGKTLKAGTDYTVAYSKNKAIGKAGVTITGAGDYEGELTAAFKIKSKATSLSSLSAGKKKLTVKWKKAKGGAGYQLQYSLKKNFAGAKTVTISKNATVKTVLKKLKSGKTYYVRIRAYKKVGGVKYVSAWSKAMKKKVK